MQKGERKSVVIVGGGHNGLTAATYLAKAGVEVTVLERLSNFGGAAISAKAFEGVDAMLSRYSYLVSLLPEQIIAELGLNISLAPRRYSSYTPVPGTESGLLVDNQDAIATSDSFAAIGSPSDHSAWESFYRDTQELASRFWPGVLKPLRKRSEIRSDFEGTELWEKFIERPVGEAIAAEFSSDWVQGVVYTDALIGTFAPVSDSSLSANRCFLYHVIGGGTGDWNVPIGGMGAVSGELERAARDFGAKLISSAEVVDIETGPESLTVRYQVDKGEHLISADLVLANTSRQELVRLLGGEPEEASTPQGASGAYAYGAQVKVNLLLSRLPKLLDDSVSPEAAFGGTFHINESFSQLQSAYEAALKGEVPNPIPCEIYCHSLTDPSILGEELRDSGAHTLTVFALQAPHSLVSELTEHEHDQMRLRLETAVFKSLNSVLAELIEDLLLRDASGKPCVETKTTRDLDNALRLPGGNIFHEPLSWPFAEDHEELNTPAQRWGVATGNDRILMCGSSARRGGAVSGIAGHNAAMAALELLAKAELTREDKGGF